MKENYPVELMEFRYANCKNGDGRDDDIIWSWADKVFIKSRKQLVKRQKVAQMDCEKFQQTNQIDKCKHILNVC